MLRYRYSQWDGTQLLDIDADDILSELADDLTEHGDLRQALQRLMQRGTRNQPLMGLQDMMRRLREQQQQRLSQYNLGSVIDEIKKRLEEILNTEKEGIERRLEDARQRAQGPQEGDDSQGAPANTEGSGQDGAEGEDGQGEQGSAGQQGARPSAGSGQGLSPEEAKQLLDYMERMAQQKREFLESLPQEVGGSLSKLSEYDFMDSEAKRMYDELMEMLKQQVAESLMQNMMQGMSGMTPEDMQRMQQMIQALNQMLRERMSGGQPDFQSFMEEFGDMFGPNPPKNLEELLAQMHNQMQMMQDLLNSMTPGQRQQLQELVDAMFQDMGFQQDMMELATYLNEFFPRERPQDYPFQGDDPLTLKEAMRLMEEMSNLEDLEQEFKKAQQADNIDDIDVEKVRELLGDEEAQSLEALRDLAKKLEDAGYMKRVGNKMELTPKAIRRIGQKALRDIFGQLRKDRVGSHETEHQGIRGDFDQDSKPYQFGDPFYLNLEKTLMNALHREGPGVPVKIAPNDFDVYRTEQMTQSSTVLLLDQSRSMGYTGRFLAAKRVALALESLIRTQFPRDNLYVIGFADYARELRPESLPQANWSYYVSGTNMHHAFMLSRQLLSRHKGGTKQIILISDGEPTAHLQGGNAYFAWPPTYRTIQETLREVKRCTREGITINTFMLEHTQYLVEFVNQMAKINKGRVFYTSPDKLGEYVLVDFLAHKRRRVS